MTQMRYPAVTCGLTKKVHPAICKVPCGQGIVTSMNNNILYGGERKSKMFGINATALYKLQTDSSQEK